jgi:peptidoglycan/xylan/chitin deacetylase (PgdA/CDA1 family)
MLPLKYLRLVLCCVLPLTALLTGCNKIKALTAKKSGSPPANASSSPAAKNSAPMAGSGGTNSAPAAPKTSGAMPMPAMPVAPAINKSAAVMVLCYHRFEDKPKDALAITPALFEEQMKALQDNGFSVIPMQDFLAWRRGDKDIPAKCAIVTIDDGYLSGYEVAWPILKKFNYPFTMFVYINYIGSGGKSISWDQLAEMRDAGVDIQSHTYTHSNLRAPGNGVDKHTKEIVQKDIAALGQDGWLHKEIAESKQVLEKQLGIRVNAIAYPFGIYSQKVRDIVKEAGYEAAFTVYGQRISNSSPPFDSLGRYAVEYSKPEIFKSALAMVGGGVSGGGAPSMSAVSQLASASMITQPMDGETISNPKPLIKANLATMGDIEPGSLKMRVSGQGLVSPKYDAATKTVSYQVSQPLQGSDCTVILTAKAGGKQVETRWSFKYDPTKK